MGDARAQARRRPGSRCFWRASEIVRLASRIRRNGPIVRPKLDGTHIGKIGKPDKGLENKLMDDRASGGHPAGAMNPASPLTDPVALLRWYADAGIEDCSLEEPQDRYALSARPAPAATPAPPPPVAARGMGEAPV